MGLFRRQVKGKHSLGAAVTSIPAGPLVVPVAAAEPVLPVLAPEPVAAAAYLPSVQPDVLSSMAELFAAGDAWASEAPAPKPVAAPPPPVVEAAPVEPPVLAVPAHEGSAVAATPPPSARATLQAALSDLITSGEEALPSGPPLEAAPVARAAPVHAPVVPLPAVSLPSPGAAQPLAVPVPLTIPVPAASVAGPAPMPVAPPPPPAAVPPAPAAAAAPIALDAALDDLLPQQVQAPQRMHPHPHEGPARSPAVPAPSRVQLGFRDGTSAALDPSSSQFLALEQLAQTLTRRD